MKMKYEMEDVTLAWPGSMTTEQAKKYLLTAGFVPVELFRHRTAQAEDKAMDKKQQVPSAGPDFVTKLPEDRCADECCGEIGEDSRALKHALCETPMQSDQIVALAKAVRLLAFHVERVNDGWQFREELRGIRDNMEDLIYIIKGRKNG